MAAFVVGALIAASLTSAALNPYAKVNQSQGDDSLSAIPDSLIQQHATPTPAPGEYDELLKNIKTVVEEFQKFIQNLLRQLFSG